MASMKKMLVTAFDRDPDHLARLGRQYDLQLIVPDDRQAVPGDMSEIEIVYGQLTPDQFAKSKELRWVQSPSAGVEWMWRVPGLADTPIQVTNMRGAHAATIAEHAFAMLLTHTRGLRAFEQKQKDHEWGHGTIQMHGLKGATMGIIGFGNIGRAIARRATGFEMRVLAVDIETVPPGDGVERVWPLSRLTDLCREADVVAISAPITPTSRGMLKSEHLKAMKRGSFLLQMSRGGIVDETALVDALEEGHLAGAGLDVTATEPLPVGDPLWTAPNLIVTPHSSATSDLTTNLVWSILEENLSHYTRGEPLINLVDKRRGW
jgi:phosphoglycerate dehydrogenase-like enzyme